MAFIDTPLTVTGPARSPRQMLAEQTYGGHASVHDDAVAGDLGLTGAPIEGPTHFSQLDPLAFHLFGQRWFEEGCVSAHFRTMVVEGEDVVARAERRSPTMATVDATKGDGSTVLVGTVSVGPDDETELDARLRGQGDPGDLHIVDQLSIGQASEPTTTSMDMDSTNGPLYPFSLAQKLQAITEPSPWYAGENPWGRPIIPFEMVSVLSEKAGHHFPVRGPSVGLFLDLEVRMVAGPLFVGEPLTVEREVVGLGQSRKTESYWVRTTLSRDGGEVAATVLLHSGVFKASYAGYPTT